MAQASARFVSVAARHIVPVLLAFFIIAAAWLEPAAWWIAQAASSIRGVLPRGDLWSSASRSSGNLYSCMADSGWSGLPRWLDSTPWPAMVIIMIAAVRSMAWLGVTWSFTRCKDGEGFRLRFGSLSETISFIAWAAIGSIAWRFWWSCTWHRPPGALVTWFPIEDGSGHIGLLWLGAVLGHASTLAWLARRAVARSSDSRRCINCGYSLQGLDLHQTCPECGQDQRAPLHASRWSRTVRILRRHVLLVIALVLLASPYLSTLLQAMFAR